MTILTTTSRSGVPKKSHVRKQILRVLNSQAETKGLNYISTSNTLTTAGTIFPLSSAITNGSEYNQRSGAQVTMGHFNFSYNIIYPTSVPTAALGFNAVRIVLFQDREAFASAPAVSNVLESASYLSDYDVLNVTQGTRGDFRFKILYDNLHSMTNVGQNLDVACKRFMVRGYVPKVQFLADTFIPSALGRNSLFLLAIAQNVTVAPLLDFSAGFRYHDM